MVEADSRRERVSEMVVRGFEESSWIRDSIAASGVDRVGSEEMRLL